MPPHGGIGRGQEGGGELDVVHAPLVGGGGEARHVPGDAAPQGQDKVGAGEAALGEKFQDACVGGQIFVPLPGGEGAEAYLKARLLEGAAHNGGIEFFHRGIGDDGTGPGAGRPGDQFPGPFQKAGADVDGVGRGGLYGDGLHVHHFLLFKMRRAEKSRRRAPGKWPGRSG